MIPSASSTRSASPSGDDQQMYAPNTTINPVFGANLPSAVGQQVQQLQNSSSHMLNSSNPLYLQSPSHYQQHHVSMQGGQQHHHHHHSHHQPQVHHHFQQQQQHGSLALSSGGMMHSSQPRTPSPQFQIQMDQVLCGNDIRTTVMLRNIPNKYTRDMLLEDLDMQFRCTFDFLYLPMDFQNDCNMGYAFLNFIAPTTIVPFFQAFHGRRWNRFNSEKIAEVTYAKIQGKQALIEHFKKSNVMLQNTTYRPLLFHSTGPQQGFPEQFPGNLLK
eukprot:ANDGO_07489.mRNA.1 Protein MEI2-like 1